MPSALRYNCPECRHPWKLHDRFGCTRSVLNDEMRFEDCECSRPCPAGHRD